MVSTEVEYEVLTLTITIDLDLDHVYLLLVVWFRPLRQCAAGKRLSRQSYRIIATRLVAV